MARGLHCCGRSCGQRRVRACRARSSGEEFWESSAPSPQPSPACVRSRSRWRTSSGNIANSQTTAFKRIDSTFVDLIPDNEPTKAVRRQRGGELALDQQRAGRHPEFVDRHLHGDQRRRLLRRAEAVELRRQSPGVRRHRPLHPPRRLPGRQERPIPPAKVVCCSSARHRQVEPVSFSIELGIERLLDCPANHLAEMIPYPGLINLDHLAHRSLVAHLLLLHSRRSRRSRKCERFQTLSRGVQAAGDRSARRARRYAEGYRYRSRSPPSTTRWKPPRIATSKPRLRSSSCCKGPKVSDRRGRGQDPLDATLQTTAMLLRTNLLQYLNINTKAQEF